MKKTYLSHTDIEARVVELAVQVAKKCDLRAGEPTKIYPVPRGGVPVVYVLKSHLFNIIIVDEPTYADIIVDDVIDSGSTRKKFMDKPFFALYNKLEEDKDIGWIIFPWENSMEGSVEDVVRRIIQCSGWEGDFGDFKRVENVIPTDFGDISVKIERI